MKKRLLVTIGVTASAIAVPTYFAIRKLIARHQNAIANETENNRVSKAISGKQLEYHNVKIDVSNVSADFNGSLYAKLHELVKGMYVPLLTPNIILGQIRGVDALSLRISFPNIVITEDDKTYQLS